MMFETKPVRITELAKETEQYLLQKGNPKTGFANAPCFKAHECFGRLSKYRRCSAKKDARTLFNCARTV